VLVSIPSIALNLLQQPWSAHGSAHSLAGAFPRIAPHESPVVPLGPMCPSWQLRSSAIGSALLLSCGRVEFTALRLPLQGVLLRWAGAAPLLHDDLVDGRQGDSLGRPGVPHLCPLTPKAIQCFLGDPPFPAEFEASQLPTCQSPQHRLARHMQYPHQLPHSP